MSARLQVGEGGGSLWAREKKRGEERDNAAQGKRKMSKKHDMVGSQRRITVAYAFIEWKYVQAVEGWERSCRLKREGGGLKNDCHDTPKMRERKKRH